MNPTPHGKVAGKVAFITGAARGQGRSHAIALGGEGADIIAVDSCASVPAVPYPLATPENLDETAQLVKAAGGRIVTAVADVRDRSALERALADGVDEFGRLDIVLANAGVSHYAPATAVPPAAWSELIDVNLNGVWWTVDVALPHLLAGGRGGSIVITSSTAGLRGLPNCVPYTAAKHAVVGLMRSLALDLGQHHIRVNTIHPGNVDTDMVRNDATYRLFLPGRDAPSAADMQKVMMKLSALPVPWADAGDISDLVLFLVSDAARLITGATLAVDAGLAARW